MTDPSKLYENIPDCYSRDPNRDNYKLLAGLAEALSAGKTAVDDFCEDTIIILADGEGLSIAGENLGVSRPPGMRDPEYAVLIPTVSACSRGTIQAIRSVFEAASGMVDVEVKDKQLDGSIPIFEVWIYVKIWSEGRAAYAGFDTQYPNIEPKPASPAISVGWPVESCIAGDEVLAGGLVFNGTGLYGGEFNDHWWDYADEWTKALVNKVKLAGTVIVYKLKYP